MYFIYLERFYKGNINDQCQDNYLSRIYWDIKGG